MLSTLIKKKSNSAVDLSELSQLELRYFALLSRKVQVSEHKKISTTRCNLIYTIARAVSHPNNYKGNPHGVKKLACGISFVRKEELQEALKINQNTLYRLLSLGVYLGFWRRFTLLDGIIYFSLRSPKVIAKKLGLSDVGTFGNIELKDFTNIEIYTTEMVALGLQEKTFYAAKAEAKKAKKTISRPGKYIFCSDHKRHSHPGKPVSLNKRYVGIDSSFQPYGVSLEKISEYRGVSYSTAQKHLDNRYRKKKGAHYLCKRQTARKVNVTPDEVKFCLSEGELIEGYSPNMFFIAGNEVYLKSNNLYYDTAGFSCKQYQPLKRLEVDQSDELSEKNNSNDDPPDIPNDGSNKKTDETPKPKKIAELIRDWEKLKGTSYKPEFFQSWEPYKREAFLNSPNAYCFLNKENKLIKPCSLKQEQREFTEVKISLLDYAEAVNKAFRRRRNG